MDEDDGRVAGGDQAPETEPRRVFISHSSADDGAAREVCARLEAAGHACWIATRDIKPGREWGNEIVAAILGSSAMIVLLSDASNDSRQVAREVERADHRGIPVIAFRLTDIRPSGALEYFLSHQQWLDGHRPPFSDRLDELVAAVDALVRPAPEAPPPTAVPYRPPVLRSPTGGGPGPPTSSPGRRRGVLAAAVAGGFAVAALAVVAAVLLTRGGDRDNSFDPVTETEFVAGTETEFGTAEEVTPGLIDHVPGGIADSCTTAEDDDASVVERLDCQAGGGSNLTYRQFETDSDLQDAYDAEVEGYVEPDTTPDGWCERGDVPGEGVWTLEDADAGRLACYDYEGSPWFAWTHDELLILTTGSRDDGDWETMYADWLDAGPE